MIFVNVVIAVGALINLWLLYKGFLSYRQTWIAYKYDMEDARIEGVSSLFMCLTVFVIGITITLSLYFLTVSEKGI